MIALLSRDLGRRPPTVSWSFSQTSHVIVAHTVPGAFLAAQAQKLLGRHDASQHQDRDVTGLAAISRKLGLHHVKSPLLWALGYRASSDVPSRSTTSSSDNSVGRAIRLLVASAAKHNPDALYLLGEINLHGNYSQPRNLTAAYEYFDALASLSGNSSAHYVLGFLHSTGLGNVVPRDQAKALLHHQAAADGGDVRSEMTLAYRYHTGFGVMVDCEKACAYYKKVAQRAIDYARSGPAGGRTIIRNSYRLADEEGGVYGSGASISSSGVNAADNKGRHSFQESLDDVMEYLDLVSRKGDATATLSLGKLHYDGSKKFKRDYRKARSYFLSVARERWSKDGSLVSDTDPIERPAAQAAGFLGRMFLRAEGVEQDLGRAITWLRRGVQHGDMLAQHSLGVAYLEGLGVPKDAAKAVDLFKAACQQGLAISHVFLGRLLLDQGDINSAINYFDFAASIGQIEGFFNMAEIHNQDLIQPRSCHLATIYYKLTAEKVEHLHTPIIEANEAYDNGDISRAFVGYLMAAEQGFEHSQQNVAYILDNDTRFLEIPLLGKPARNQVMNLRGSTSASEFWARSAKQSNHDSALRVGDSMLRKSSDDYDPGKAAAVYEAASERSAQALWNLGWMHENGYGVEQDFHLAKRHYDSALEISREAFLPVTLALMKLHIRSTFNTFTAGKVRSVEQEQSTEKKWSLTKWLALFLHPKSANSEKDEAGVSDKRDDQRATAEELSEEAALDLLETSIIISLVGFLTFMVYYRYTRQVQLGGGGGGAGRNRREDRIDDAAGVLAQPPPH